MGNANQVAEARVERFPDEIEILTPHLPVAELLNGGIIRLVGINGFFNVDSLLEPSWLRGKMTIDDYRSAIKAINRSAANVHVQYLNSIGIVKIYERETEKTKAIMHTVADINRRYTSVHFTYQQGAKDVYFHATWTPDFYTAIADIRDRFTSKGFETYIYININ